ncbi:cytochrome-c peroxidase [Desulfobacterium sp. N47]
MKRFLVLVCIFVGVIAVTSAIAGPPAGLSDMEKLGRHLYKDKNLSFNGTQSCQNCHHPFAGFADRANLINPYDNVVSTGADGVSKGGRNAPTSAYAGYSPLLSLFGGEWVGGMFWDGRATGSVLGDPLAEQAQGPPLNPVEMAMPSKDAIIDVIRNSFYANLFIRVFGTTAFDNVDLAYDNFGRAVASYERSTEVTKFSSKYDVARNQFTPAEERGLALFETNCSSCHSTTNEFGAKAALFTNYKYANIGAPANPLVPVDPDLGLGPIVGDTAQDGKFKVPTLRNIVVTPPYTHNGYFPTLPEMVAFINNSSGFKPEVGRNIDIRVGNLGLSNEEIDDIVSFLMTLTDDY